ncbi:MAG: hypothetical protein V1911_04460 [Candidatus Micrarchaeota archaeon]
MGEGQALRKLLNESSKRAQHLKEIQQEAVGINVDLNILRAQLKLIEMGKQKGNIPAIKEEIGKTEQKYEEARVKFKAADKELSKAEQEFKGEIAKSIKEKEAKKQAEKEIRGKTEREAKEIAKRVEEEVAKEREKRARDLAEIKDATGNSTGGGQELLKKAQQDVAGIKIELDGLNIQLKLIGMGREKGDALEIQNRIEEAKERLAIANSKFRTANKERFDARQQLAQRTEERKKEDENRAAKEREERAGESMKKRRQF